MAEDLRAVLLGKTGAGKSSTGNTLLGRDAFRVGRGMRSGTERCQWADEEIDDLHLLITDTPGLCDTHRKEDEVLMEVGKSVAVTLPGPHVVLMVLRCDSRFTEEEFGAYLTLKTLFGDDVKNYMIIVFVGADIFGETPEEQKQGLDEQTRAATGHIQTVLQDASSRYFGINNKASREERNMQAKNLIGMMKELMQKNDRRYFSNNISDEVNDLVEPLVARQMMKDMSSRTQAEREINIAIVEEKEDPGFFSKLSDLIRYRIKPAVEKAVEIFKDVAEMAGTVATVVVMTKKLSSSCSLM